MPGEESFTIGTSVAPGHYGEMLDQIRKYYLLLHPERFGEVRRYRSAEAESLSFVARGPNDQWRVDVDMRAADGLHVHVVTSPAAPPQALAHMKEELVSAVGVMEKDLQDVTLSLLWVKGERIVPEGTPSPLHRIVQRLFSSALILLNVVLLAFSIVLFLFLGFWAVVFVLAVQFFLILFADRIFARLGRWTITTDHPQAYLLRIRLSPAAAKMLKAGQVDLARLKAEIYDRTFAVGKEPACPEVRPVLSRYGITCAPEDISGRVVDVHSIVERAARIFGAPVPKIAISNSPLPNAAASGISMKRGALLLTGGILVQLNEDELVNVIGHEMAHLQGRDPLLLYALASGEFILRVTVLLPLFLLSPLLYLIIVLGALFFFAKFLEARADLVSALRIGHPEVLAESLRKIGSGRVRLERAAPLQSWLRFDTHPPLYFRIDRLDALDPSEPVRHPLLRSAGDVLRGLRAAL